MVPQATHAMKVGHSSCQQGDWGGGHCKPWGEAPGKFRKYCTFNNEEKNLPIVFIYFSFSKSD